MLARTDLLSNNRTHDAAAVLFVATVTQIAHWSGLSLLLFPELGALAYCVITQPNHAWSRAPFALAATPALTGLLGVATICNAGTGVWQIAFAAGMSLAVVAALRSPILPALSAGILPLVLQISEWSYPVAIFLSCSALASLYWLRRIGAASHSAAPPPRFLLQRQDFLRVGIFLLFLIAIAALAEFSERPLLLFPPLAVLSFEILVRQNACSWAQKPVRLILLFFLCGLSGIVALRLLGSTSFAVAIAMVGALCAKSWLDLYVPPAIAVSIVPFVTHAAGAEYPFESAFSVALLVALASLLQSADNKAKCAATGGTHVAKETRTPARRNSSS